MTQAASYRYLSRALALDPVSVGALSGIGYLHQRTGNVTGAHQYYTRALAAAPSHVDTLSNYAALLYDSGIKLMDGKEALDEAEDLYERAVLLAPSHVRSLYNFGLFQEGARHDTDKAELLYRTALARSPTHTGALTQLAHVLMEGGRDVVGAQDLLEQALSIDPNYIDGLCQQAHLFHLHQNNLFDAERNYIKVLQLSPEYLPALNSMAALHLAQGDQEAVSRVVKRALELAPNDADTVLNSAALMWDTEFSSKKGEQRNASMAGDLVARALELDPSHVGALCFQGMWHLQANSDYEKGMSYMEQALRLDPVNDVARNSHIWMKDECQKEAYRQGTQSPYKGTQKDRLLAERKMQDMGQGGGETPSGSRASSNGEGARVDAESMGGLEEESLEEIEGPRRGQYYETVGDMHKLPDDIPAGTQVGGEGTFGMY